MRSVNDDVDGCKRTKQEEVYDGIQEANKLNEI